MQCRIYDRLIRHSELKNQYAELHLFTIIRVMTIRNMICGIVIISIKNCDPYRPILAHHEYTKLKSRAEVAAGGDEGRCSTRSASEKLMKLGDAYPMFDESMLLVCV